MSEFPAKFNFLSVDDSEVILSTITNNLKQMDVKGKIFTAACVDEGIKVLESQQIDFIISDWNMPGKTGIDFLVYVRHHEKYKGVPFLMLTTQNETGNVLEAVSKGASNYLIKPWTLEALKEKIIKSVEKHSAKKK